MNTAIFPGVGLRVKTSRAASCEPKLAPPCGPCPGRAVSGSSWASRHDDLSCNQSENPRRSRKNRVFDARGQRTDYQYDDLNRRAKTIFAATEIFGLRSTNYTAYDALGRRGAETNEAGVVSRFGYDGLGRLVAVTNAWNTADATWATYAYDEVGNETNQVDALGRITRFEFDKLGRRTKRTLPGTQSEGFACDAVGNLLRHTNFNGFVVTNAYDSMNRLLSRWQGSSNLEIHTYTATSQRASMSNVAGVVTWGYDNRDRVRTNTTPAGALYYDYDPNGNLTNLCSSTANGVSVGYQYDALNRLTNVVDNGLSGTKNTAYTFDGVGNLATLKYPNGVTNLWQYDARNRLTNSVWKLNATTNANFAYLLGPAVNRTNLSELVNGTNRIYCWGYDALYRLTNETISTHGTLGYRYDLVGNRTNRQSSVSQLPTASSSYTTNDRLTTDNYDDNGNTTASASIGYQYDWAHRLTNANNAAVVLAYDAEGNRIKKVAGGTTTLYLVDGRNPSGYAQVVEELTVSGGTTNLGTVYTYGLDLISQRDPNSSTNFFGYDGLGSTRFLSDAGGNVANAFAYDAYGTLIASNAVPQTAYLYTGEQFDANLGFYYLRARYLKSDTGRFWTIDSFEGNQSDPLSLHKYLYAQDDPVNRVDLSGYLASGSTVELLSVTAISEGLAATLFVASPFILANSQEREQLGLKIEFEQLQKTCPLFECESFVEDAAQILKRKGKRVLAARTHWRSLWPSERVNLTTVGRQQAGDHQHHLSS